MPDADVAQTASYTGPSYTPGAMKGAVCLFDPTPVAKRRAVRVARRLLVK